MEALALTTASRGATISTHFEFHQEMLSNFRFRDSETSDFSDEEASLCFQVSLVGSLQGEFVARGQ